ncbi:RNA polymerase ECF-type sigma factor SigK [Gordonia effusa NBRC 100432]|uniref:RNA polymerase ECF-type sigma factor SigK n=1 Tax=Gordonia effusa NBRC 100432 TaxID=1077974 RepID=H0R0M3_9ACTN|nr:ECF RNA polymerase sigma factor SigK [Gordonia effusa]GAB18624.1 RNA polymerase ECF-type sigma factor SigK [Gordonia effusa NBRC 100432]
MSVEQTDDHGLLLCAVGRGDRDAFDRLFDALAPQTYGLAQRVVASSARAEEVVQETWLQVWRNAGQFDPDRGSAAAWILTMARRRAIDAVRHDQAAIGRDVVYHAQQVPDYDRVSEAVVASDESRRVRHCLGGLTDLQREAIDLAYYGGLTYVEVADSLACNPATVKTRIRDGLRRLRACLGGV